MFPTKISYRKVADAGTPTLASITTAHVGMIQR
jgi:hypothetical protein